MLWSLLSLLVGAIVAPVVYRAARGWTHWLLVLLPLGVIAWSAQHWNTVAAGGRHTVSFPWAPSLGVSATLHLDGLALVFLLLICGIGVFILIYASQYLRKSRRLGVFYAYLLLFMFSMVGLVLADDIILLFVFWELTSISSFLLIGWDHHHPDARKAALTSLVVTVGGGMALLAGLVLLALISGETELSRMSGAAIRESALYLPALVLVLLGAFTKSAQFPFHFWLPAAMAAPTPVSAYLHSATMVKAGVYLLARLHPTLGATEPWLYLVMPAGAVTMVVGAVLAATQTDLKRILAYSTISALGILTLLIGMGSEKAILAALVYLVAHSLFKGALFLIAGILDHEAGTREVVALRGLARLMPVTVVAAILAGASSAGVGPLFGFLAKEYFYEALWQAPAIGTLLLVAAVASSALLVVVAMKVAYQPFFGGSPAAPKLPHEAPWQLWVGPLTLAILGLLAGLSPGVLNELISAAGAAMSGVPVHAQLTLWHGFTPVLALSVLTLLGGAALFFAVRRHQQRLTAGVARLEPLGPHHIYDSGYDGAMRFAERLTRIVQSGYLRNYVLITILTLMVLLAPPLLEGYQLYLTAFQEVHLFDAIVALVTAAAAISVTLMVSRLAAAATLGVIGVAIMLLYIIYGALDLAITQIMVETLTVILLVLVLYHLPPFVFHSPRWILLRDAIISAVFGVMVALLVVKAFAVQADPAMREFYATSSYLQAYGRNVVNVILVDFRAIDTTGEVVVLSVAGVGVYALLKMHAAVLKKHGEGMVSLVLQSATPTLMMLLLVFSIYALFRGHHESGGGFIGGLLAATAFGLHILAFDVASTRRLLRIEPQILMGIGLLMLTAAGLTGLLLGTHFLQGHWTYITLPGLGLVHVGTPLLFDIGVYAVVMGMVLNMILTAAEE